MMQNGAVRSNSKQNERKECKTTQKKWALSEGLFAEVILICQPSSIRDRDKVTAPEGYCRAERSETITTK